MDMNIKNIIKLKPLHNRPLLSDQDNNRIRLIFLITLLVSSWILTQAIQIKAANNERLQEGIAKEIIRFHVIANSNSDEDQELKYQVKDALVKALSPYLKDADTLEEAQDIISENLPFIQELAYKVIEDEGYTYSVTASLSNSYFPMKIYGDYSLPPGNYQALQVKIGDAQGMNWWCVMFPPLCFVDETYSIVDEDSKEKLERLLTEEEFESLKCKKPPVKIKFKLLKKIKKLFS